MKLRQFIYGLTLLALLRVANWVTYHTRPIDEATP